MLFLRLLIVYLVSSVSCFKRNLFRPRILQGSLRNIHSLQGSLNSQHASNPERKKVAIFGGGSFSLALSKVLSFKGIACTLLVRNETVARTINSYHYHPKYLSNYHLPETISATTSAKEALKEANYIIHAVPMQSSRTFLREVKALIPSDIPFLSVTKGIEQTTFALMSEIIEQELGKGQNVAFLSGPSFAQEIMDSQATAVVVASSNHSLALEFARILSNSVNFRCLLSDDVIGVEMGGAIKNVLAIAAGMCEGLGLGMNAMASLVTRSCLEMANIGTLYGADEKTFYGLSGVGDAFATCLGPLSRNRRVGYRLANGEKLEDILLSLGGVSEGVSTVLALEQLINSKMKPNIYDFKFPILSCLGRIIKGKLTPQHGLEVLMKYPIVQESLRFYNNQ